MARKSKQQRIDEGLALIASIQLDPVLAKEQSWLLRFLNDLVAKFKRGKGGTKRQRDLFDEKIAAGVPARKVNTHVAQPEVLKAEAALKVLQTQPTLYSWEIRVGGEIVANGLRYNLSDKQLALLDTFVKKAEQVEAQATMVVDPDKYAEAKLLIDLADTYIGMTAKKCKDIDILRSAIGQNIGFSDEQLEAGRVAVSGELKRYNKLKRRFVAGQLIRYTGQLPATEMAMVIDSPQFSERANGRKQMYIPVIADGKFVEANARCIHKYTKKELKALGAI